MIRLLYISITLLLLLGSCKRYDILNQEFIFCEATINGAQYKDTSTFKELLGFQALPFGAKQRFFIARDTIAYLQFKLVNINDPNDLYYLFGGIAYPENEKFPLLNKEYVIKYNQEFETDKSAAMEFEHYLYEQRRNNSSSLPFGVIILEKSKLWTMNDYISLKGGLTFESYNARNNKYQGHFQLYKEADELGIKDYIIIGQFDLSVKGSNE
jgi:hypothetical protein